MRSLSHWQTHPQGEAVIREPLIVRVSPSTDMMLDSGRIEDSGLIAFTTDLSNAPMIAIR